jgi:cysteine synthase
MKYYENILSLIGKTPLVKIRKLNPNPNVLMLAKVEYFNPTHSVKDRIALNMIEEGEKEGELTKDKIVIEPTSGNTGIGLAMVCAIKEYKCEIVMSESVSIERRKILTAYGAKVTLTPGELGTDGAEDYVNNIMKEYPEHYFRPNQYSNSHNPETHYRYTAEEIIDDTVGKIDVFVAGIGTSGTLMGMSKRLKEHNPNIKIVGVEPTDKDVQGLKSLKTSYIPKIYNESNIDEKIYTNSEISANYTRLLALREGIFCGISSGAAIFGAIETAKKMENGIMVVLLPDGGEKYISTHIYYPEKCLECIKNHKIQTLWDINYVNYIRKWWDF